VVLQSSTVWPRAWHRLHRLGDGSVPRGVLDVPAVAATDEVGMGRTLASRALSANSSCWSIMGWVKLAIRPTSAKPSWMIQLRRAVRWGWTLGGLLSRAWTGSD
jgi:hypothetical protein